MQCPELHARFDPSIKTQMPLEQSLSGHTHVYVVTDERLGIKWLQGVRKEVIVSPTKKHRHNPMLPVNGSEPPSFMHQMGIQNLPALTQDHPGDM